MTSPARTPGLAVPSAFVLPLLRLEGGVALLLAVLAYCHLGASGWLFAATFLLPDLAMFGYLRSPVLGARLYNLAHSYLGPGVLAALAWVLSSGLLLSLALVWAAHIGADRLLGFGLKAATGFRDTHLSPGRH